MPTWAAAAWPESSAGTGLRPAAPVCREPGSCPRVGETRLFAADARQQCWAAASARPQEEGVGGGESGGVHPESSHPVSVPAASQTEGSSSHRFWLISGEPPPPAGGAGCTREGGATGGSPPPTCTCSAPLDRMWVEDGWASRPRRRPWGALRTWRLAEAAGPGSVIV